MSKKCRAVPGDGNDDCDSDDISNDGGCYCIGVKAMKQPTRCQDWQGTGLDDVGTGDGHDIGIMHNGSSDTVYEKSEATGDKY